MSDVYVGIFEGGYDPAAAVVRDGVLEGFAEEERFLRTKHAKGAYPIRSLKFCLERVGAKCSDVRAVAINWDLLSYTDGRMSGFFDGLQKRWDVDPLTIRWQNSVLSNFNLDRVLHRHESAWRREFGQIKGLKLYPLPHHYVHAAQAYLQSPFEDAVCMTVDGSGDQHCTVLWSCAGDAIEPIYEITMPHSLGWFYAAFTEYLGFEAYDGEYKVMGLAAYGKEDPSIEAAMQRVLFTAPDGIGYRLDPSFIHYGPRSWSDRFTDHLPALFGRRPRAKSDAIEEWHLNLAFGVQMALERVASRLVKWAAKRTGSANLCIGGGVGLNVKMNTKLLDVEGVSRIFPHPLCSDSGAAAGAALVACWQQTGQRPEKLWTLALGSEDSDAQIEAHLRRCGIKFERPTDLTESIAEELCKGRVVGWFQGRMEAGPRALGQRSILADPRNEASRDRVNAVIKYREPWRPFCPSMTLESAEKYLERCDMAPFMIIAFRAKHRMKEEAPAVVHVDGTARVQLVDAETNPLYHKLLLAFEKRTGVPILLNTSFNVKGEPIVCNAIDAIRTFYGTGMDCLALGSFLIRKP